MANEIARNPGAPLPLQGLTRNPVVQQLGLLLGIAAAVAIGVSVVLWSRTPNYGELYNGLSSKNAGQVIGGLQKLNIPYEIEPGGMIMVPAGQVADARMKLAAQGLPRSTDGGLALLNQSNGFGASRFIETARYQYILERQLARSIGALDNVRRARVSLAVPKQSVFVSERAEPTASVLVDLYSDRDLSGGEVAAIQHLVAFSVPNLKTSNVTVVDQRGRLLSGQASGRLAALDNSEFQYTRRLDRSYVRRIDDILTPIVGIGGVRAQVATDLDFTMTDETQEKVNPKAEALLSEQVSHHQTTGEAAGAMGVPGALSNEPPGPTTVPQTTPAAAKPAKTSAAGAGGKTAKKAAVASAPEVPTDSSSSATRNYELDKTISHTQLPSGRIKRLSVAVVVDDIRTVNSSGQVVRAALSPQELTHITALVKSAVGFDPARGDSINVINIPFHRPRQIQPPPPLPIWERPWVWSMAKQGLAGLVVLFLIFGVLRPVTRGLLAKQAVAAAAAPAAEQAAARQAQSLGGPGPMAQLSGPGNYDAQLNAARSMSAQDPKRVAQVVKTWVASDG
ncbi:MAG: flagellar basal-body MS-ring/collar protein FliF [Gammaproteobacteria bacterium]|nr:flagellar basal-body MS-ring/collar protein FliF [Gammaproteobacteria bacterium]